MRITINHSTETVDYREFIACNQFTPDEADEIENALRAHGRYEGGGGAQATYLLEVAPLTWPTFKYPTVVIPSETMELYRAQSRRVFGAETPFIINSLDEDCPYARDPLDEPDRDELCDSDTFNKG